MSSDAHDGSCEPMSGDRVEWMVGIGKTCAKVTNGDRCSLGYVIEWRMVTLKLVESDDA